METELILIRHGHAVRVNGNYVHAPLTELGRKQADLTGQECNRLLQFGQQNGEYWPLRLQLVGKMLLEDKILAARENDADYYRPDDPVYWQEFEKRLEETYRGVVR